MRQLLAYPFLLAVLALGPSAPSSAHHSFAMFDAENPIELQGTVTEFRFTSPHSFILLKVGGPGGAATVWSLEGVSPSSLVRDGWNSKTLQPGDEIKLMIAPLRSGAPGGAWNAMQTRRRDDRPIVIHH